MPGDLGADDLDAEIAKQQQQRGTGFGDLADDDDLGYSQNRYAGFEVSIRPGEEEEEDDGSMSAPLAKLSKFTAPKHLLEAVPQQESEDSLTAAQRSNRISDREDEYHARRQRLLSPTRTDAFSSNGRGGGGADVRSYKDVMTEQQVARERDELRRKIKEKEMPTITKKATSSKGGWAGARGSAGGDAGGQASDRFLEGEVEQMEHARAHGEDAIEPADRGWDEESILHEGDARAAGQPSGSYAQVPK